MKITYFLLAMASASVSYAQTSITQLTNAAHSRGYIAWQPVTGAHTYKIVFYDQSNPTVTVLDINTNSSFIKVDPSMFQIPNLAYRIDAINAAHAVITSSTPVPNEMIIGDPTVYEDICETECNGVSYAYGMTAFAEKIFTGGTDENHNPNYVLGAVRLRTEVVSDYYNPETGVWVPFYQPMSTAVWTNLGQNSPTHPYIVNADHDYDKIMIPQNGPEGYVDATNHPINSGWLIPKKFDQFSPFNGVTTLATADASMDVCSAPITGLGLSWVNFFNQHHDVVAYETANAFVPYSITSLACQHAFEFEVPDGFEDGAGGDDENWDEWLEEMEQDFAKEHHDLNGTSGNGGVVSWPAVLATLSDFASAAGPDGDYVTNIVYTNVHNPAQVANVYRAADKSFTVKSTTPKLSTGLYTATAYTALGKVMPYYMNLTFSIPSPTLKDLSSVIVVPNPIVDELLKFQVTCSNTTNATYLVHDINGTELATGSIAITENTPKDVTVDLSLATISSYHVILSVLFNDGSALQQLVEVAH